MYRIRADELPQYGMSRVFVGAERGDVAVCADLVNAPLGKGPPPHRHPYDKVAFVQAGRAKWTVNGEDHDAQAGDILVVKAGGNSQLPFGGRRTARAARYPAGASFYSGECLRPNEKL
jgi:mannose-6-phosphate isomerase-like protein (cupin superfamily)